jgi:hypothetical protein
MDDEEILIQVTRTAVACHGKFKLVDSTYNVCYDKRTLAIGYLRR